MTSRKIEPYIYEFSGVRAVSYEVVIDGSGFGRVRSLDVARRIRDEHLAKYGEPRRHNRRPGTGSVILTPIGHFEARYGGGYVGMCDTIQECEELLRTHIAGLATHTWYSGRRNAVARTLPQHAPSEDRRARSRPITQKGGR